MNSDDRLCLGNFYFLLADKKGIITLITVATILIAGGLTIAPVAYSTGGGDDSRGDDSRGDDSHGGCGDDSHGDDSHGKKGDDCNPEPDCDCKKPTVFSVIYNGPGQEDGVGENAEVTIEIYKKVRHIGEKDPLLTIEGIVDGESIIIDSKVFGKKKINSNTVYHVIQNDVPIATISFHTSCSDDNLFIGTMHSDGPVKLTVESGFDHKERQSIFLPVDPICNEVPTTTLKVKKVLSPEDDLGTFILQIDGVDLTTEIGNGGTTGSVDVTPGSHTVGEIAGVGTNLNDYSTTIGGDCNADGTIVLEEGDDAVCTITNTLKIPATITLKKVITQDNTDEIDEILPEDIADSFDLFITNVNDPGNPIEITMENQEIDAGTYTLSETGPQGFEFVLISGDTGCPSMVEDMEEFTIQEGEHLTCVIYNDDDKDAGEGGTGVSFGHKGFQWNTANINAPFSRACNAGTIDDSCIEIIAPGGQPIFLIVDSELKNTQNTLVLWSMTAVQSNQILINNCVLVGIFDSVELSGLGYKGFGLTCPIVTAADWNINYAFIETVFAPVV